MERIENYPDRLTQPITIGVSMAAKRSLLGQQNTLQDFFDTQDALDNGSLDQSTVGRTNFHQDGSFFTHGKDWYNDTNANKDNFSSILGGDVGNSVAAYKKRKLEQQGLGKQGVGQSQSILGGSVV